MKMSSIVTLTMNPSLDIASATDTITPDDKLRCSAPQYDAGGGGINVARAIKLLGGDPLVIFPTGGPSGKTISDLLRRDGVRHQVVPIHGSTRENFHIEERTTGQQYRFVIEGPTLTAEEQGRCLDAISALQPAPQFLVASGSLPPGVPDDFYASVARIAADRGTKLVLDTSGQALARAGRGIFLVKPSLQELEELVGSEIATDAQQEEAVKSLISHGFARIVVLSLGKSGALLGTATGVWRLPPIPVSVRSTVGAGDSMVAAIVLSLARGWSILDAVKYGIAAATAALLHSGTQLCRRDDVDTFYAMYPSLEDAHPSPEGGGDKVLVG